MDKVKLFQRMPGFLKTMIASARGYQLKALRSSNRKAYLEDISIKDKWSKEQIHAFQQQKLKETLEYAINHVPFYREMWKSIKQNYPDKNPLDINNWPVLEKDTIRNNPELFISDEVKKSELTHMPTSGTSGKPMNFWLSQFTLSYWYAMYEHRIKVWNGVSDKDRWANIGGQLICAINQKKPPFWTWNFGMKQLYLSSYHITPENVPSYIEALKKYKITYLLGYVSSIYNLANEGLKQGLKLPKFKVVITNAEPLYAHQKETIEKAFSCVAIETFSACEFSFGSNQNMEGHMYIWPEAGFVEVLDENGNIKPSGKGQLIITGFLNKAMPLIRYKLGDTATLNTGQKGSLNYDYFEEITGRTDDMVVTIDGKFVGRLDPVFKSNINIKESQIIQEDYSKFTIKLVPDKGFSEKDIDSITERLKDRVGKEIEVNFEIIDQIPRGANGKFKAVVSKIKSSQS